MSNQQLQWVENSLEAASQDKKVLAVEGKSDVAVYREWLKIRLGLDWANQIHIVNAQDRRQLLSGLRAIEMSDVPQKEAIFGLADRDEWEAADIASLQEELPTLLVNQMRHALESYFCDPDEIEVTLRAQDAKSGTAVYEPYLSDLRQQIESAREVFVPNWALGHVLQRANEKIRRDAQYPHFLSRLVSLTTR